MKKIKLLCLLLLPLLQAAGQQPEADIIMNKARDLTLSNSLSATISLLITEKNGSTRTRTFSMLTKSYPDGTDKRFLRFLSPADISGTSMLIIDNKNTPDEMWIYLPALRKTRRIVSSEKGRSFMSSEFSNADMSSPPLSDFNSHHLANSGENNMWIIESVPVNEDKADEYGYSKKITYISVDKTEIKKIEFYNFNDQLFKILEVKSIQAEDNGRYTISDMLATNLISGRSSEIKFNKTMMNANISDSYFTIRNMEN
jgi:hypothetical protein